MIFCDKGFLKMEGDTELLLSEITLALNALAESNERKTDYTFEETLEHLVTGMVGAIQHSRRDDNSS